MPIPLVEEVKVLDAAVAAGLSADSEVPRDMPVAAVEFLVPKARGCVISLPKVPAVFAVVLMHLTSKVVKSFSLMTAALVTSGRTLPAKAFVEEGTATVSSGTSGRTLPATAFFEGFAVNWVLIPT